MALMTSTTTGPVERPLPRLLSSAPATPAIAPKVEATTSITLSRSVHCRAAAAGATMRALISTTPTACRPMTTPMTSSVVRAISSAVMG